MKEQGLVSKYTVAQYKPQKTEPNEEAVENVLDRNFNDHQESSVVVSDLTYVRVNNRWSYVCFLVDLFNREIIGHSAGPDRKSTRLNSSHVAISYAVFCLKKKTR